VFDQHFFDLVEEFRRLIGLGENLKSLNALTILEPNILEKSAHQENRNPRAFPAEVDGSIVPWDALRVMADN